LGAAKKKRVESLLAERARLVVERDRLLAEINAIDLELEGMKK
jgi:hypothetical protein